MTMARKGEAGRRLPRGGNLGYERYLDLVARLDGFLAAIRERYGQQILCPEGCSDCCRVSLTLWPVEAYHLARGVKSLSPSDLERLRMEASKDGEERCPLLIQGRCALYSHRPILCRTHGFPFLSREEAEGGTALLGYCPRSLRVVKEEARWEGRYILDLDNLNYLLAAVNQLFVGELPGPNLSRRPIRISLAEVLSRGETGKGPSRRWISSLLQEKARS